MILQFYIAGIPPSVNHYWRVSPRGRFISKAGMAFRAAFIRSILESSGLLHLARHVVVPKSGTKKEQRKKLEGDMRYELRAGGLPWFEDKVRIAVRLRPRTLKCRPEDIDDFDPDNVLKAICDCLKHFGVIEDDSIRYVRRLEVDAEEPDETARTMVLVEQIDELTIRRVACVGKSGAMTWYAVREVGANG